MIAALLCLSLAQLNSTSSLGPIGALVALAIMSAGLLAYDDGLTSSGGFRDEVEAVTGEKLISDSTAVEYDIREANKHDVKLIVPLVLLVVFRVALGIDYNIFLMAWVREETFEHGSREGLLRGFAVTGGVITSAGVVLAGTFLVLAILPLVFLTEMGLTVAFGVLLDTFLVRTILVPALALDIGPKIWWPSSLAKEDQSKAP